MADILSKDEIDALLGATEDGEKSAPRIMNYDFKHPARVNKSQLRTLENLHDNLARLLSYRLSRAMRMVVDVDTAFVDQTTYAEFIMSLSNPAMSYQFTMGPTQGQAIFDIAMPVTCALVDRAMGGKGASQGVAARVVTPVEIGEVNSIVKGIIEDIEATWEPILRVEIYDIELETNPEFMQITAPSEIVILLAFEVNSTHASGLISLCYPFFTLESILPRLSAGGYVQVDRDEAEILRRNRLRLGKTPLGASVEVGRGQVTLEEARRLQVGDVVKLDTHRDEPAVLFIGNQPKYKVLPFSERDGRMAVKVAGEIAAADEEAYRR